MNTLHNKDKAQPMKAQVQKQEPVQSKVQKQEQLAKQLPNTGMSKDYITALTGVDTVLAKYKPCHEGNVKIMEVDGITYYAGGFSNKANIIPGYVLVNLTGTSRACKAVQVTGFRPKHLGKWQNIKEILIDVPDYGIPHYPLTFYQDLVAELQDLRVNGKLDVLICCQGGHGRTGTLLAILVYLLLHEQDPIVFVREHYCKKAIESQEQVKYIGDICGIDVSRCQPSDMIKASVATLPLPTAKNDDQSQDVDCPYDYHCKDCPLEKCSILDDVSYGNACDGLCWNCQHASTCEQYLEKD